MIIVLGILATLLNLNSQQIFATVIYARQITSVTDGAFSKPKLAIIEDNRTLESHRTKPDESVKGNMEGGTK